MVIAARTAAKSMAGRADLLLRALHKVLEVLQARLIIQTEEQTSVARAEEALAMATQVQM